MAMRNFLTKAIKSACAPCAAKTCAVRPVFARVVGELQAADPSKSFNVQGPMKQNASPGEQSEAPRRRWKAGQEQHAEPHNQDSKHMLKQPRLSFPDLKDPSLSTFQEEKPACFCCMFCLL